MEHDANSKCNNVFVKGTLIFKLRCLVFSSMLVSPEGFRSEIHEFHCNYVGKMDFSHCYSDFSMRFMSRTKNGKVPPSAFGRICPCFFGGTLNLPWNLTYTDYISRVRYHAVGTPNMPPVGLHRTRTMWQFPEKGIYLPNCYHEYIADGETQFGFSEDSSSSLLVHVGSDIPIWWNPVFFL